MPRRSRFAAKHLISIAGSLTVGASSAYAQTSAGDDASGRVLEVVTVTAQKRAESLQDTPIAVTVFDGEKMEAEILNDVRDVALQTPNLVVGGFAGFDNPMSLRGIHSAVNGIGADGTVGVYVDGVYLGRSTDAVFELANIDRIEVLRGPQGTLYGRNTIGGAINVVTKTPGEDVEVSGELGFGSQSEIRARGFVSGPLSDSLAGSLSLAYRERDGFARNVPTGEDIYRIDTLDVRGALAWTPDDSLRIVGRFDFGEAEDSPQAKTISPIAVGPEPGAIAPASQDLDDIDDFYMSDGGSSPREYMGVSLDIQKDIGDFTITSISSFRDNELSSNIDTDGRPLLLSRVKINPQKSEQFAQEFRLDYDAGGALKWVAGAYYFNEEAEVRFNLNVFGPGISRQTESSNEVESYAFYTQADYAFTDRLSLTAGLRYNDEEKTFSGQVVTLPLTPEEIASPEPFILPSDPANLVRAADSWSDVTGKLGLNFELGDSALLYGSVSTGFRSGGFNWTEPSQPAFDPETIASYELGAKFDLFDNRMRINSAFFYSDYEDLQLRVPIGPAVLGIENAANAEIYGAEIEFEALLGDWRLFGNAAYLSTEFKDSNIDGQDISGNELPRAPEYSFFLGIDRQFELASGSSLTPKITYAYTDDQFYWHENYGPNNPPAPGLVNYPLEGAEGYGILNAFLSFDTPARQWQVALWAKNLTDERFFAHINPIARPAVVNGHPNEPRMFGITFRYRN